MIYGYARVSAKTQLEGNSTNKKDISVSAYSLRKLSDTERKNASGIPYRVSEYLMGHNKNALDLRYVKDYYSLAKECMPVWEKILDGIIGNKMV